MRVLFAAAALSLVYGSALAQPFPQSGVYGSLGYTSFDGDEVSLGAVTGRLGARVHPNLGVEGEGSFGVRDDSFDVSINGAGKYELKHDVAVYAVGFLPISDNVEIFARVGYGTTKVRASVAGVTPSQDGDSLNYGIGGSYFIDGRNGVRTDWTRRAFRDDRAGQADTWSISYIRRF